MSLLQLAQSRYSVRQYSAQPVPEAVLDQILQSARLAPSACNLQPWHFYVCRTSEALDKVRQCYPREWFTTAPMVIVCTICHDQEWVRPADQHRHGIVDISIAAEHICLAATDLGLGTCWVCNFDAALCHDLLSLPDTEEAAVLIPLGYPACDATEKKRKAMADIVTFL